MIQLSFEATGSRICNFAIEVSWYIKSSKKAKIKI